MRGDDDDGELETTTTTTNMTKLTTMSLIIDADVVSNAKNSVTEYSPSLLDNQIIWEVGLRLFHE